MATAVLGGTLALAASASAIQIPIGSSSDAPYAGSGTPTSIYSIFNGAYADLKQADQELNGVGDTHSPNVPLYASFPPAQGAGALTEVQALSIAADFSATTVTDGTVTEVPSSTTYAATLAGAGGDPTYNTDKAVVIAAGQGWNQLSGVIGHLGAGTGGVLNSADTARIQSSGTVTAANTPIAYNITVSAPSGGYILPSAFTLTFPAGLGVNTALVGAEVNAAANGTSASAIAAVEAKPTGTALGTATLTSPLADAYGGANNQVVGKVYAIQTGMISGQGSITQPYLELWFAPHVYALGSFPTTLALPLTLRFGLLATPAGPQPLAVSKLALRFPAATSPVEAKSCTTLGTVGGSVTDDVANLAYAFGDTRDGISSAGGHVSAVALASTPTVVTNKCRAASTASGSAAGLTGGHPTVKFSVKAGSAFQTLTLGLAGGLKFVKSTKLAKEVSGAKIKSVRIAGGQLVISLRSSLKAETIQDQEGSDQRAQRPHPVDQEAQDQEADLQRARRKRVSEGQGQRLIAVWLPGFHSAVAPLGGGGPGRSALARLRTGRRAGDRSPRRRARPAVHRSRASRGSDAEPRRPRRRHGLPPRATPPRRSPRWRRWSTCRRSSRTASPFELAGGPVAGGIEHPRDRGGIRAHEQALVAIAASSPRAHPRSAASGGAGRATGQLRARS